MDAVPCGYNKQSPNRMRPGFQRGPLQMIGWLVALVYNAVADLAAAWTEIMQAVTSAPCGGSSSTDPAACISRPKL